MAREASADPTLTRRMQKEKEDRKGSLREFQTHLKKRCNFNLFICTYIQTTTALTSENRNLHLAW